MKVLPLEKKAKANLREVLEWVDVLIKALALFIIIYHWVFQISVVHGESMAPLFTSGDRLIVEKVSYHFQEIQPGDLVVFQNPRKISQEYLKRVYAGPSDHLEIREGQVYVNEKEVSFPGVRSSSSALKDRNLTLELAEYYVLGDNRPVSLDSRDFGPVPQGYIKGKVWMRFWPLSRWKFF
jgi:signal peptidase I